MASVRGFWKRILTHLNKLRNHAIHILHALQDRDRLVTTAIHLPLYVAWAICAILFVYSKTEDNQERLQVPTGWRRIFGLILQSIITLRMLFVFGLCFNEHFRWTFKENFTADAVAYSCLSLMSCYPLIAILSMNLSGGELCQLYNAIRQLNERFSGVDKKLWSLLSSLAD